MAEILSKIPDIIQIVALVGMMISLLATVLVRITPSTSDDEKVGEIVKKFMKILQWLPTIGVNPQTKKLEEAYEELKSKNEQPK